MSKKRPFNFIANGTIPPRLVPTYSFSDDSGHRDFYTLSIKNGEVTINRIPHYDNDKVKLDAENFILPVIHLNQLNLLITRVKEILSEDSKSVYDQILKTISDLSYVEYKYNNIFADRFATDHLHMVTLDEWVNNYDGLYHGIWPDNTRPHQLMPYVDHELKGNNDPAHSPICELTGCHFHEWYVLDGSWNRKLMAIKLFDLATEFGPTSSDDFFPDTDSPAHMQYNDVINTYRLQTNEPVDNSIEEKKEPIPIKIMKMNQKEALETLEGLSSILKDSLPKNDYNLYTKALDQMTPKRSLTDVAKILQEKGLTKNYIDQNLGTGGNSNIGRDYEIMGDYKNLVEFYGDSEYVFIKVPEELINLNDKDFEAEISNLESSQFLFDESEESATIPIM